jgi:FkbM family methyltransferase
MTRCGKLLNASFNHQTHDACAELLVGMVQRTHSATTDDDLVSTLQAVSALSVCLPQGVIMPALHAALTHLSPAVRAAAASFVSRLLTDTQTTVALSGHASDGQTAFRLNQFLAGELAEWGILTLLVKSARDDPLSLAAITALKPFFDDFTKDYFTASQAILAQQQARDCRSLLKSGSDAAARRNESTAALLAWAHTRSARWATELCPALPEPSSVMFPCSMHRDVQAASIVDPCLENHVAFLRCNAQAQATARLTPADAALSCQFVESAARRCDYAHNGLCGWDGASAPPFSAIRKARTWAGPTLYHAHDLYFRVALELYGEWARGEVEFMLRFLPPGATFVDAGAHVGTISLAVARQLGPSSTVIAIEATRLFASLALANAAAAGLAHMRVIHAALSNTTGCFMARVVRTYTSIQNMGGQQLMRCPERVQRVCDVRNCAVHGETFFDGSNTYEWCEHISTFFDICFASLLFAPTCLMQECRVPSVLIDNLGLQRCDVLKMDVEAMEGVVAQGARRTIATFLPMVFYENNGGVSRRADLTTPSFMEEFGYKCFQRSEPLWRSDNWAGVSRNVFAVNDGTGSESHMIFCVHPDRHMGPDTFFIS